MKDFVPYEQALALKELGFDEPCFGYYVDGELRGINLGMEELGGKEPYYQRFGFHTLSNHDIDNPNKIVVTAPTFSQAFRWFREKYNVHSSPRKYDETMWWVEWGTWTSPVFETYEEAEFSWLEKLIELVKDEKKNS